MRFSLFLLILLLLYCGCEQKSASEKSLIDELSQMMPRIQFLDSESVLVLLSTDEIVECYQLVVKREDLDLAHYKLYVVNLNSNSKKLFHSGELKGYTSDLLVDELGIKLGCVARGESSISIVGIEKKDIAISKISKHSLDYRSFDKLEWICSRDRINKKGG